jgi:hypothetical protein
LKIVSGDVVRALAGATQNVLATAGFAGLVKINGFLFYALQSKGDKDFADKFTISAVVFKRGFHFAFSRVSNIC